ncbi:hypothetical protein Tco_0872558 [Tanacetum coccineum]
MTVEEVNTRVTKLAELHEHDTQDLYALLEDAQDIWKVEEEAYASQKTWALSIGLSQATHQELQTHCDHVYAHETHLQAHQTQLQLQGTLIQTQHQTELLALRGQWRARQPTPDARILDHQDASGDADSHGTEGVVGLTRWIEKIESVFNISGCAIENQVNFATYTLLGATLTWWNGHIRTLGPEAYAMTWEVKGNDVPTYTERFQELTLICTKFVANETEKVDKYISGLPDNIYENIKSARPKMLDETIELANDLMDQKLRTYAERQQNVVKVYNMETGEKKLYGGSLPKSTGNTNIANAHKGNGAAPKGNGCFECGALGHFNRDFLKLKNKDGGNGNAQGLVYAIGNAKKRGNASGNMDSNVVTASRRNHKQTSRNHKAFQQELPAGTTSRNHELPAGTMTNNQQEHDETSKNQVTSRNYRV